MYNEDFSRRGNLGFGFFNFFWAFIGAVSSHYALRFILFLLF